MLLAIAQLPSLEKAKKNAFEVAKTITGENDVVIYPVTEFIGVIYKKQASNYDLKFARALRKLYEKNEKNFIAMYKDSYKDRFFIFVRNKSEIESYIFEAGEAIPGIVSVLMNFYKNSSTKLFFIVSDSEEENEESRKILNSAIDILNSKNEDITISPDSINYNKSNPQEEDYELLLKKDTASDFIFRYLEKFIKSLNKRRESSASKISKNSKLKSYGIATVVIIVLAAGGGYYYKEYYLKKKKDIDRTANKIERKNRIEDSIVKKKNSFILQILINNIDKLASAYSDRKKLYITSTDRLKGYDNYNIGSFPQTGYYLYSIPLLAKNTKIKKIEANSSKNCKRVYFSKSREMIECKDNKSELDYLTQLFINSNKLFDFSIFRGSVFLNTISKNYSKTKNHSFSNIGRFFRNQLRGGKNDYKTDRGKFKKL